MTEQNNQLIEIYKLHAELADRVSQRREGANRLYVGILTAFLVAVIIFARLMGGGDYFSVPVLFVVGGIIGVCICASWYIIIRSYRQLNAGKFATLIELEGRLPYQFFAREWQILEGGENFRKYWRLTVVETMLPLMFFVVYLGLLLYGLYLMGQ